MTFLYYAYGSNLNREDMKNRCPSAIIKGTAVLVDYELLYRGEEEAYLTIEKAVGKEVMLGIWEISEEDLSALDEYEGYPELYRCEEMVLDNQKGIIYIMNDGYPLHQPTDEYRQTCMRGYKDFGFDMKYLQEAEERSH